MSTKTRPRVPPEIRVEMFTHAGGFLPRITRIVESLGPSEGEPAEWLSKLTDYLAGGDAMIVNARLGRTLVGFVVLNTPDLSAPFSWVDPRFRNKGLGERFYSFACINMAVPRPEFRFPVDHLDEFGFAVKSAGVQPILRDTFYVMNERPKEEEAA
jgi:GNAT superfamily N-acetyltransferase